MSLPWHEVEKEIQKEINWLKKSIPVFNERGKLSQIENKNINTTNDYTLAYRNIALSIICGDIQANELNGNNIWYINSAKIPTHKHGKEWHQKMMNIIDDYFTKMGYSTTTEPNLNYGRADLGFYKKDNKNIFIEVDTVSIEKLWINLKTMKDCIFLSIPSEDKIIEFLT